MPQLLRNNAAEGVSEGLDSHIRKLDRTEKQRQFDVQNLLEAQKRHSDRMTLLYGGDSKNPANRNASIKDPLTGKPTTVGEMIGGLGKEEARMAGSPDWWEADAYGMPQQIQGSAIANPQYAQPKKARYFKPSK